MQSIQLAGAQRGTIVEKKVTCPFLGPAVAEGLLPLFNTPERPLTSIADVVALGDCGGGDLGSKVLALFATGSHSRLPGADGRFEAATPDGMMSLDLPGSQGAHPGHSAILMGDPGRLDSGRFDPGHFARLADHSDRSGRLTIEAIGEFIAENLARDPASRILPVGRIARDLFGLADEVADSLIARLRNTHGGRDEVELREKLTRLAGEDNLIGSAGEFGLLFAFLANRPEPNGSRPEGIRLADVEQMFVRHRLPEGWEAWPKHARDWVHATTALTAAATRALLGQKVTALFS